ncbi:MAG: hypothetical protein AAF570_06675 [Bacteroidota bacterium]
MSDYDFQFGAVTASGRKDHGSNGWESRQLSVGHYRITFTNRFENTPTFAVTPERDETSTNRTPLSPEVVITRDSERRTQFEVFFRGTTGVAHATQFNFIAIARD